MVLTVVETKEAPPRSATTGPSADSQKRDGAAALFATALKVGAAGLVAMIATPAFLVQRLSADPLLDEIENVLSKTGGSPEPERVLATVLFTDIAGSTERAAALGDHRWRELLEAHDLKVRRHVSAHGGRVLKSMGDGYFATFDGPARAIRCGRALVDDTKSLGLQVKVGVHTGECEAMGGGDLAGLAVHIAARVVAKARPGEVLVTRVVRDLVVGSGVGFAHRGAHQLKGVPGVWPLLAVEPYGNGARRRPTLELVPEAPATGSASASIGEGAGRIAREAPAVARRLLRIPSRR
jgi:class 3 adenylate cyclase